MNKYERRQFKMLVLVSVIVLVSAYAFFNLDTLLPKEVEAPTVEEPARDPRSEIAPAGSEDKYDYDVEEYVKERQKEQGMFVEGCVSGEGGKNVETYQENDQQLESIYIYTILGPVTEPQDPGVTYCQVEIILDKDARVPDFEGQNMLCNLTAEQIPTLIANNINIDPVTQCQGELELLYE